MEEFDCSNMGYDALKAKIDLYYKLKNTVKLIKETLNDECPTLPSDNESNQ